MKTVKLKIEGMSCQHCVKAVLQVLEGFEDVRDTRVEIGQAEFELPDESDPGPIINTLEDQGYKVLRIDADNV